MVQLPMEAMVTKEGEASPEEQGQCPGALQATECVLGSEEKRVPTPALALVTVGDMNDCTEGEGSRSVVGYPSCWPWIVGMCTSHLGNLRSSCSDLRYTGVGPYPQQLLQR